MDPAAANVISHWFDACHRAEVGLADASTMGQRVLDAYVEPHRRYHTLEHVQQCLTVLDDLRLDDDDRLVADFAVWFHDVVYDPTAADNEAKSADLARAWLGDHLPGIADRVGAIVEMTAGHRLDGSHDLATDPAARAVHDVDLGVLGVAAADYDRYAAQIREEYAHVNDGDFAAGRSRILTELLDTDRLYVLEPMRRRFEAEARLNLTRELETLSLR